MSTIPTSLTEEQFYELVSPYVSKAQRGCECQILLSKVFNNILYWLHTGCQWDRLPIDPDPHDAQKRTELAGGILSLSQMESGWQSAARLAIQY